MSAATLDFIENSAGDKDENQFKYYKEESIVRLVQFIKRKNKINLYCE